jgi:hypothetical protein
MTSEPHIRVPARVKIATPADSYNRRDIQVRASLEDELRA